MFPFKPAFSSGISLLAMLDHRSVNPSKSHSNLIADFPSYKMLETSIDWGFPIKSTIFGDPKKSIAIHRPTLMPMVPWRICTWRTASEM